MTPRPLCDAERAAIAARYGVRMNLVPSAVIVCPPRTYALDAAAVDSWKAARDKTPARLKRQARMVALRERERKAAERPAAEPAPMVMVKAGKRSPEARERKNAARRAQRAAARAGAIIARAGAATAQDMEWLRAVQSGLTHQQASIAIGRAPTACQKIAARLRANGITVPASTGPMIDTSRDLDWLRLVESGMGYEAAAREVGYSPRSVGRLRNRLKAAGHVIPPSGALRASRSRGGKAAAAKRDPADLAAQLRRAHTAWRERVRAAE